MITLNQRHIITIIDLLKKEEDKLKNKITIRKPGSITIDNWQEDEEETSLNPEADHYKQIRELLEAEMSKATFTFGLNERIQSLND